MKALVPTRLASEDTAEIKTNRLCNAPSCSSSPSSSSSSSLSSSSSSPAAAAAASSPSSSSSSSSSAAAAVATAAAAASTCQSNFGHFGVLVSYWAITGKRLIMERNGVILGAVRQTQIYTVNTALKTTLCKDHLLIKPHFTSP